MRYQYFFQCPINSINLLELRNDKINTNCEFNFIQKATTMTIEDQTQATPPQMKWIEIWRQRIQELSEDLHGIDVEVLMSKIIEGCSSEMTYSQFVNLLAETSAYISIRHPSYSVLAGRIKVAELYELTPKTFSDCIEKLNKFIHEETKQESSIIDPRLYKVVQKHKDILNNAIEDAYDLKYDYFGFKTLERSYLLRVNNVIVERIQYMWLRAALGIHMEDVTAAIATYKDMRSGLYTHATPTLFNSGTNFPQMSSCFLEKMKEDSFDGIFDTLKQTAIISKYSGGIGLSAHEIRATGSFIQGTNGKSNGLVPMLSVFNETSRYADQGGGKRKGAFAIYLEPWHADVELFLEMRTNRGHENLKNRDLFQALWIPDLFMKRVDEDGDWSLFCPRSAPGLNKVWGEAFEELYVRYERQGIARKVMKARDLWFTILEVKNETGLPYMLAKDSINRKSNHQHLGTIECSNLCTEIMQFTSPDEVAVCNLLSLALSQFLKPQNGEDTFYKILQVNLDSIDFEIVEKFDFEKLARCVKTAVRNLNQVIDRNFYPVPEAKNSNLKHRPVGIGVQGLADLFAMLHIPFGSPTSRELNRQIFECIYFNAMYESCELAKIHGPYESYVGSPVSKGILQPDMWTAPGEIFEGMNLTADGRWNWTELRQNIDLYGVRNSLLVAPMPTASTSQILGNNECFEPFSSNIYSRNVLSGTFPVVNKHLVKDMMQLGLWTPENVNQLLKDYGSVQNMNVPQALKEIYKTVWEMSQRILIDMARDRNPYIDQGQSMNVFLKDVTYENLGALHFYAWEQGLKTLSYYLRSLAAYVPVQFTIDANFGIENKNNDEDLDKGELKKEAIVVPEDAPLCRRIKAANGEICYSCGS